MTLRHILSSLMTAMALLLITDTAAAQLRFGADHKFKIVQFTDVHWIYNDARSDEAGENMRRILDAEKPDLVVFTGDVVFASPAKPAYDQALAPVIERNLPFAVVLGNHDIEFDLTGEQILEHLATKPGNLTSTTTGISGVTNYLLTVKQSDANRDALALYMFDSHRDSQAPDAIGGYAWIERDQIDWYCSTSDRLTAVAGSKPVPAVAFMHIPVPEFEYAVTGFDNFMVGTRKEAVCCPKINTGLFASMLIKGDIMCILAGHDHVNDFITEWKGIALAYGRYTGGATVYNDIQGGNGARVIEFTEGQRTFRTWIRLNHTNQVIQEVTWPGDFKNKK